MPETVAILGASTSPDRYAHKALQSLQADGHTPVPINPKHNDIDGVPCFPDLVAYPNKIDTVTVYVKPTVLVQLVDDIIAKGPARVILNPGTESGRVREQLEDAGIQVVEACTLVMLRTGQFSRS